MRNLAFYVIAGICFGLSCGGEQDGSSEATVGSPGKDAGAALLDATARANDSGGTGFISLPDASPGDGATVTPGTEEACAAVTEKAEAIPLDIVMMMDQSDSMNTQVAGGVQWNLVANALRNFVTDPRSDGIGVSIQYFGIDSGDFDWFGLVDTTSCDRATYATPDVPMTRLPSGATALVESINRHHPSGNTPTTPALLGALDYASAWAQKEPHPQRRRSTRHRRCAQQLFEHRRPSRSLCSHERRRQPPRFGRT